MGSTREARRAGMQLASKITASRHIADVAMVLGSVGWTPNRTLAIA